MPTLTGEGGEAGDAIRRLQEFDASSLVRESELGSKFALRECVAPAQRVVDLFKQISPAQVGFFAQDQQNMLRDLANGYFNLLDQCLQFEIEGAQPTPTDAKNALVQQLEAQFQPIFSQLHPLISYATTRAQDFAQLERDARAATQATKDNSEAVLKEINQYKTSIETILGEVRAMAAEQGVSKQAIYYKGEADKHAEEAGTWLKYTICTAIGLGVYAIGSLFLHEIPGLQTTDAYRTAQIAVSKVLIFGVIAYMLLLCARNFLSHKHNEVVNRHRQNALATFTALAEATSDAASSDIVLSHAASCIFSPQDSGYIKSAGGHGDSVPGLQLLPRLGEAMKVSHG